MYQLYLWSEKLSKIGNNFGNLLMSNFWKQRYCAISMFQALTIIIFKPTVIATRICTKEYANAYYFHGQQDCRKILQGFTIFFKNLSQLLRQQYERAFITLSQHSYMTMNAQYDLGILLCSKSNNSCCCFDSSVFGFALMRLGLIFLGKS